MVFPQRPGEINQYPQNERNIKDKNRENFQPDSLKICIKLALTKHGRIVQWRIITPHPQN